MPQKESTHVEANAALYAQDFFAWCQSTAAAIRAGTWDAIDPEALAEEVESLGKSEKRELESRLEVLVMHLLKWEYQPERRREGHSWFDTIVEQRSALARLLRDNPSLRPQLPTVLTDIYPTARRRAIGEMAPERESAFENRGQGLFALPPVCVWPVDLVLHDDFWPDPLSRGLA
jgi:hypothetical protein